MAEKELRGLGVIRRSRKATKNDVSEHVQMTGIEKWAAEHSPPIRIVGWAIDLNVSGSADPFSRGELGEWLNNRLDKFDTLLVFRQDRLSRNQADTHALWSYVKKISKGCAFTSEGTDLSNPDDHMAISLRALMAEEEWKKYTLRARENKVSMRQRGEWTGGRPGFGLRWVNKRLEWDPEYVPILLEMIDWAIDGVPLNQIAERLQERQIPTPEEIRRPNKAKTRWGWTTASIDFILTSRKLIGQSEHRRRVVRDNKGDPIMICAPLIDEETFTELQSALRKRRRSTVPTRSDTSLLRRVGKCVCGSPVHYQGAHTDKQRRARKARYGCDDRRRKRNDCVNPGIIADIIENTIEDAVLNFPLKDKGYSWDTFGDIPRFKREYRATVDYRGEIRKLAELIRELNDDYLSGEYEDDEEFYRTQLDDYQARRKKLLKASKEQGNGYHYSPTGLTVREYWNSCNTRQRNQFLVDLKITITYDKTSGTTLYDINFGDVEDLVRIAQQVHNKVS